MSISWALRTLSRSHLAPNAWRLIVAPRHAVVRSIGKRPKSLQGRARPYKAPKGVDKVDKVRNVDKLPIISMGGTADCIRYT